MSKIAFVLSLVLVTGACGGSPPAPVKATSPRAEGRSNQPSGERAADHDAFMADCGKEAGTTEGGNAAYCECGWKVFSATFTGEDWKAGPSKERLAEFQTQMQQACTEKLPEPLIKQGFVKGCVDDRDGFAEYCDCLWPELRKDLSITEIASLEVEQSTKFGQSFQKASKTCGPKLSDAVVKKSFMAECAKEQSDAAPFCECAWKQVLGVMPSYELETTGLTDVLQQKIQKACTKLKPKSATSAKPR